MIEKTLSQYIMESFDEFYKLSKEDKEKLLELDREYNRLIQIRRNDFNEKDIKNLDDEMEIFFKMWKKGKEYFPKLKLGECLYDEDGIVPQLNNLLKKFQGFTTCFLSRYYIENIKRTIEWCQFYIDKKKDKKLTWKGRKLDPDAYKSALKILKETEFKSSKNLNRNIDSKEAKKQMERAIDELGFDGWKVEIAPDMVSRMNVLPNNIIRICETAMFNEADIEGLIAHEIKGHIGRRFWGAKTGLYLFVHGLYGRNILDEGLAVWNSLNLVEHDKPNVMFNIALKYVIAYNKYDMNFCELFKFIKSLHLKGDISDNVIFKAIARAKREIMDTELYGGIQDDADYYAGYLIVDKMSDKERDEILKYNVGMGQIHDIPLIKKFLKINKFEELH